MKTIEGYALLVSVESLRRKRIRMLFGKGVDREHYQNISSNGLSLFESPEDASSAAIRLKDRREMRLLSTLWIKMRVAESYDEWDSQELTESKSLIIICNLEFGIELMGRYAEGKYQFDRFSSPLAENNFRPFRSYERARYIALEMVRQSGGGKTSLATFHFKKIN